MMFVHSSPDDHPSISDEERKHINDSLNGQEVNAMSSGVPWKSMFTSIRVWAIIIGHASNNVTYYLVVSDLPLYFRDALHFEMQEARTDHLLCFIFLLQKK